MEETISRIVSSSSTTRMRSLGMVMSGCIAYFRPRHHIPKVTMGGRKSGTGVHRARYLESVGVRAPIFRAPIYGSCQTIWEFRWHVDRPLVDGAKVDGTGNSRPDLGSGQSAFLPRFSGPMSAGVGSGLGRLWGIPVGNWLGRVARRAEVDSRIRAGRLCAGDGIVCGCGSDIGAGAASADRGGSDFGGIGLGPFLFGAGLLTLNLHWPPFTSHIPSEGYLLAEVLFGSSILLVVLDDSRLRTRRLAVLNELTVTIARGQNHAPMMQTALEKLKAVVGAKAAWFQLMESDHLIPTQHVGLSPEFLRAMGQTGTGQTGAGQTGTDEAHARVLRENRAAVMQLSDMSEPEREQLRKYAIHHVLLLPV